MIEINITQVLVALVALLGAIITPILVGINSITKTIAENQKTSMLLEPKVEHLEKITVVMLRSVLIRNYYTAQTELSTLGYIRKYTYLEHTDILEQYNNGSPLFKIDAGVIQDIIKFYQESDHELLV